MCTGIGGDIRADASMSTVWEFSTVTTATTASSTTYGTSSRIRKIAFWLLMALLVFLHLGDRPQMLIFPVTAFTDTTGHELHMFTQGLFAWVVLASIVMALRRPVRQVGAAWTYMVATIVVFVLLAVFADLPPEVGPILAGGVVIALAAFLVHPAPLRAKLVPSSAFDARLLGLAVVGAIPLVVYAVGQLSIHLSSGPSDEHFAFGHWVIMASVALMAAVLAIIAALGFDGSRVPLWASGLTVGLIGVFSLVMTTASQMTTLWASAAIIWAAAFIASGTRSASTGEAGAK